MSELLRVFWVGGVMSGHPLYFHHLELMIRHRTPGIDSLDVMWYLKEGSGQ